MSLTSFLKMKDVREKFVQQFPKPKFTLKKEILAPPRTNRYSLVGTAFDYLLRFYLEHLNPGAITGPWVAEHVLTQPFAISMILREVGIEGEGFIDTVTGEISFLDRNSNEIIPYKELGLFKKITPIIEQAKSVYNDYLAAGQMNDELMESALLLAQIDPIFRQGRIDENIGSVDSEDVDDLRTLISIVNPQVFRAVALCLLNPTFGEASHLVGGADADLVIDDTLIDIKTTKYLKLTRDYFLQIMGYYVLYTIGGIPEAPGQPTINKVGIYYSRYAELYSIDVDAVIGSEDLQPFIGWFKERASEKPYA